MERIFSKLWSVYLLYFSVIALLRFQFNWELMWIFVGGWLGLGFVYVDRLIYVFISQPEERLSVHVKSLILKARYRQVLKILRTKGFKKRRLPMRSVFFMGAWVPVALFLLTSSGSALATGLIMGIGLHLLFDVWRDWDHAQSLKRWLFWPVGRPVSDREMRVVVGVFALAFIFMNVFLI